MLIFLYGSDTYRLQQSLQKIKQQYLSKNPGIGGQVKVFNETNFSLLELTNLIKQAGLLSSKCFIVLDDCLVKLIKDEDKQTFQELLNLAHDNPNTLLVKETSPDKRTAIFKTLDKSKIVQEYGNLTPGQLKGWIKDYLKNINCQIESPALDKLANQNADLWQITNELEQYCALTRGKIKLVDLKTKNSIALSEEVFNLLNFIVAKQKPRALVTLNRLLDQGADPLKVLGGLAYQFRNLIRVASLENMPANKIAETLNLKPMAVNQMLRISKTLRLAKCQKIYQEIEGIEIKLKTSSVSPSALLNLLLLKI